MGCLTCEPRAYYPAPVGLFKLRLSDGDLVYECRPTGTLTTKLFSGGGFLIAPTFAALLKANLISESGGLVSSIDETGAVATSVADPFPGWSFIADVTADYLYILGRSGSTDVLHKFDITDGSLIATRSFTSMGDDLGFRAGTGEEYDIFDYSGSPDEFRKYNEMGSGSPVATSVFTEPTPCLEHRTRFTSDGTYYYCSDGTVTAEIVKVNISDLTVATTQTITQVAHFGEVRDGYFAYHNNGSDIKFFALHNASDLSNVFTNNTAYSRCLGIDVCSSGVATVGLTSGTSIGGATSFDVNFHDTSGSLIWNKTFTAGGTSGSFEQWPDVVISSDESLVFVYGPFSINGIRMGLIVLDATDGSRVWCFASPTGLSVLESGDYIYLGTVSGNAPTYR